MAKLLPGTSARQAGWSCSPRVLSKGPEEEELLINPDCSQVSTLTFEGQPRKDCKQNEFLANQQRNKMRILPSPPKALGKRALPSTTCKSYCRCGWESQSPSQEGAPSTYFPTLPLPR